MAIINLTTSAFTSIPAGLLQFKGGAVELADSATPAPGDFTVHQPGDLLVSSVAKFGRARGTGVTVVRAAI